jgi:DNA-binding CsgD family transcriptional regulator
LKHYGILRRSGRYPWGSGDNVEQRSKSFFDYLQEMLGLGLSKAEIAEGLSMNLGEQEKFTSTDLIATKSIARAELKAAEIARARQLREKGMSPTEIGKAMGKNESSVRALLKDGEQEKADILRTTASMLRNQVDEKKFLDVGAGNEMSLGVSPTRLNTALAILKDEGYQVHRVKVDQMGTSHQTEHKVLCPPGTTQKEAWLNRHNIRFINEHSEDGGRSFLGIHTPLSVDSKRIQVRYAEDGGKDADGLIYLRPGPDDLSLGKSAYAQVRIAVDGTHYLKGMAMYKDDLPPGTDIVFNTNKSKTDPKIVEGGKLAAMKEMKADPDNPFGSVVRQIGVTNEKGELIKVTSAMNLVNEAGDWDDWNRNLSSQMLSKQSPTLASKQLEKTYSDRKKDLDEIMALTNPAVRKKLLETYADDADAAAVHLKAAALPRQRTQVILPIESMKPNEVYAPNFRNGERVALIRFPHGGKFEIPELTVNNNHPKARKLLGQAPDAIGIHSDVAKRLSGADFDGDTVLVIPNPISNPKIKTMPALEGLKDFDPQLRYPAVPGTTFKGNKQQLMGDVSNLITDMTIQGAGTQDLARAVRHSMVVIDAEKHNLNYKQSALDNGITQLKQKYQGAGNAGAATLISRRKSPLMVPERKPRPAALGGPVNKDTGELEYVPTNRSYTRTKVNKRTGETTTETVKRVTSTTKLAEAKDAHKLSSGTKMEAVYADHSNRLKALANQARKEAVHTKPIPWNESAKKVYGNEVRSLNAKLRLAEENRPKERAAQVLSNSILQAKKQANPDMDKAEEKKVRYLALEEARRRTGAKKNKITFTDREWEAIQAGAISNHKLSSILTNADTKEVRQRATPKPNVLMTSSNTAKARRLLAAGKTQAEVADALGVSLTTLKNAL